MKYLLVFYAVLCFSFIAKSQNKKWKAAAGIGMIDAAHISISHLVFKRNEISIQIGAIGSLIVTPALEHKLYFKKSNKFQSLNTWYFGQKVMYFYEKNNSRKFNEVYLNATIGKDFNLSERFGLNFEIGGLYRIYDKRVYTSTTFVDEDEMEEILPSIRLQLYYRF